MKPYILLILVLKITISRAASLPFNYIFRNVPTDTEFYGLVKKVERNVKAYSIRYMNNDTYHPLNYQPVK